ncbi:caskin-1 isoform X6 [Amblyraja radiata]|uniref:caskin-1 isoform X6 n=1 Tax=Amblyraja radiata TaxID=386614 RepID=UPI001401E0F4|nr:caskin-1 isoform X6 [Amblyraja radiata]
MGKDQELLHAVKSEDVPAAQKLLQRPRQGKAKLLGSAKRVNVNFQDLDGFSALHHAALNGNTELISMLIESQALVDIKDNKAMRPLHYAAWQGKAEPMKMLLKAASSVNSQSEEGQIPLHLAAQHGHYEVSEMLLQHQSNPCIVDIAGKTPLDLACEFGRVGVVQLLLSSNMCAALLEAKPGDITDPNGTSPLHLAAKNGHIDIIRLLLQAGIDINRQTKAGTALHEAALCGKTDVVRLLLESGVNAHIKNTYNQTALDIVHQFTATQASKEIKQMLRDASAALQVRAVKDYCNNYDLTSLNVKTGDIITVLEQHPDGRWKGCIHDNRTGNDRVGYFPSSIAEVINKRSGGDRSNAGSTGSVASVRSSGSGQSAGTSTTASGSDGNKLLQVVLSQKGSASETAGGDGASKSEQAAGVVRPQGAASGPVTEQPYGEPQLKKAETLSEAKNPETVFNWLSEFQLQQYAANFINAGYDIPTISRMTPEAPVSIQPPSAKKEDECRASGGLLVNFGTNSVDRRRAASGARHSKPDLPPPKDLTAIGVTKPGHRKKIAIEINRLNVSEWLPDYQPNDLMEWLSIIGLAQYYKTLVENGYENIEFITDITWEDLQEIGITKLGHQKKFMLAVKKLAEIQRASRYDSGTLKKKAPQSLEIVAIESPQGENAECQSPKLSTFQDSELSNELQVAMTGIGETKDQRQASNHASPAPESTAYHQPGCGQESDSSSGGKANGTVADMSGAGNRLQAAALSKSQENLVAPTHRSGFTEHLGHTKRAHRQGVQRASVPPAPGKQRAPLSHGHHQAMVAMSTFTPPQTTTKPGTCSSQTLNVPHATAKVKPIPQLLQAERPMSPRSPTHRGFAYVIPQPSEAESTAMPVVPVLRLPPPSTPQDGGHHDPGRPKKRAHSLSRYAVSDSEQEKDELALPDAGPYATIQRRVARSHSARAPPAADSGVNRSQSFALRPRKKGPPPPPPKRSSSAISTTNLADDLSRPEEMAVMPVETVSAGSVRSIAAMLELSSIGGGARALSLRRSFKAQRYLEGGGGGPRVAVATPLTAAIAGRRLSRDTIGLDGEVINRRRTISGPVTGLIAAVSSRRDPANIQAFAEDGTLTIKQRPRLAGADMGQHGQGLMPLELRRSRVRPGHGGDSAAFHLIESSTVKRRPKARGAESPPPPPPPFGTQLHNGMAAACKRRPASDMAEGETYPSFLTVGDLPRRNSEHGGHAANGESRRPLKPPVSPKPSIGQPAAKRTGPPPTRKTPLPGPGPASPGTEVKRAPPPVSPKPILPPPLTPPKPIKPHTILQSLSAGPTPVPSPAKQPTIKAASTPASLCSSPAKPIAAGPPHQVPVKPPRSSISGPSIEIATTDVAQMKLEETSASLAAALQAVEEKIKHDEGQEQEPATEVKSTGSILDDIGSMFDDLADQLDAMLE